MRPLQAAAAALILSGCGYVGEPMYPLLNIPEPVTDLAAVEHGRAIVYHFTMPALTTEGKQAKIGRIEIRAGEAPPGEFNRDAWLSKAIELAATPDERGEVRSQFPANPWLGKEIILGVRVYGSNGRAGEWSLVPITVVAPLAKPDAVSAMAVKEGVRVSWRSAARQHRVFRRVGDEMDFAAAATVEGSEWLDAGAEFGKLYRYRIQAVQKTGNGDAESEISETREITPADTFPPAVPSGLAAVTGTKSIELVWERNTEADLAGYRLYRASAGGKLEKIADIQEVPSYSDPKVESGKSYRYAVSAIDRIGNESPQSEPVDISAP
ncbi:MAG TPA: hypothetical protein VL285_07275 [Bryobacteraceae bacterium]|nr:hypothetical protein [Bryobacteraceae bacterium]